MTRNGEASEMMSRCFYSFLPQRMTMIEHPKHSRLLALVLLTFVLAGPTSSSAQKIKPEDIVARHLEAIGPAKARASARVIAGTSQVIFRTPPPGQAIGRAVF